MNHRAPRERHASAVGGGVTLAIIHAKDGQPASVAEWILFCETAAAEAHAAIMEAPPEVSDEGEGSAYKLMRELHEQRDGIVRPPRKLSGAALSAAAHEAAASAFRFCLPPLTGRRATQAFIACVAVGVSHGYLTGNDSRAMLYTAQLALSAHPKRQPGRGRKRTN